MIISFIFFSTIVCLIMMYDYIELLYWILLYKLLSIVVLLLIKLL